MNNERYVLRIAALSGFIAAAILVVMIAVGLAIGPELSNLQSTSPALVAELFANSSGKLRGLMIIDDLFALAYTIAFIGLAVLARKRYALFAWLGLGFALTTGILDWLENSMTLGLIAYALPGAPENLPRLIEPMQLFVLNLTTQMKYLASNGAIVLLGVGIWNDRWLNRATTILFLLYAPINVIGFIAPVFSSVRILWMLAMLVIGALLLWRET